MNKITLTINKRELEFSFGLGFLGELLDQLDLSIDDIVIRLSKNPFKMLPTLMYHSAIYVLERKGQKADFSLNDFIDWIDLDGGVVCESCAKFIDAFDKSMRKDVPVDDNELDEVPENKVLKSEPKKK